VNDFWQMVWEAGVHLVLDLSQPKINTTDEGYGEYFPMVADHSVQFGEVSMIFIFNLNNSFNLMNSRFSIMCGCSLRKRPAIALLVN